jgi:tRNA-specific 2-thiouridylase
MGERAVVAMSGGVDSSVAAALLVERGYEAVGVTMSLADGAARLRSLANADDARRVADRLGIPFVLADYAEQFRHDVEEAFADAYLAGRTPIPCVRCNTKIKFECLFEQARIFGASRVASGHYARIGLDPETGLLRLRTAADAAKDQTYFLFQLSQAQLAAIVFPLGDMTKKEVRALARRLGLPTAEKAESQEICFVRDGDYAAAVESICPERVPGEGEIVNEEGRVVGRHPGIHHFTVGQRRRLGLSAPRPLYVVSIDAARNRVVVGGSDDLRARGAHVAGVSWIAGRPPERPVRAHVKIRYRDPGSPAEVEPCQGGAARVVFDEPARAVTPGQAAVFYDGDVVLGGGSIAGPLS